MNKDNFANQRSIICLDELVKNWTPIVATGSLFLILIATLFPFNFSFENGFSLKVILSNFFHPSDLGDCLRNIFLFIPFGLGVACSLPGKNLGGIFGFTIVFISSISLSLMVEILQVFLPMRSSSIPDLVTNTIGGCIGFVCAFWWRFQIFSLAAIAIKKCQKLYSIKILTLSFISYFSLMTLTAIALQKGTNLSNWERDFFLSLGNKTADINNSWNGHIAQLEIADRALSEAEIVQAFSQRNGLNFIGDSLIASYQLSEGGRNLAVQRRGQHPLRQYSDRTKHLPALVWQGNPSDVDRELGVSVSGDGWLKTVTPATAIAQKLSKSSQFTISAILTSKDPFQFGNVKIITLSSDSDPEQSNFTLAQQETDLVFHLRSPVTGDNATSLKVIVPDVFVDLKPYHIIIVYDGLVLRFYIDRAESIYSLNFSPNITFFRYLLYWSDFSIRLDLTKTVYKIFYYGIVFIPLGLILGLIFKILKGKSLFYILLILGGIILPSLILEGVSIKRSNMLFDRENILLSLSIISVTALLVRGISLSKLKNI